MIEPEMETVDAAMAPWYMFTNWYPVVNDLIGGWSVATADKPLSHLRIEPHMEDRVIADCLNENIARFIAEQHNAWLRN